MFQRLYKGNYKLLMLPPILLILLSLYFITQIKLGVEFKGGTLITLTLAKPIGQTELSQRLAAEGIEGNVRIFSTATGYNAEIELPHSEILSHADELRKEYNKLIEDGMKLEWQASQNSSMMSAYLEKRNEIDAIADELFELAGSNMHSADVESLNVLTKEFNLAYNKIYSDYRDEVSAALEKNVEYSAISVKSVSPLLSVRFLETALWVVGIAAVLSMLFVLVVFRTLVPSAAVLIGAASDVIIALGAMGFFDIPLTLPSFAALLMLIGFSLDTDVLLTMRMLKRTGDPAEKAADAMATGVTMSTAAIIAFSVLFVLAVTMHIPTYYEIAAVALAGLVGDLFATWGINAVLLLWYIKEVVGGG